VANVSCEVFFQDHQIVGVLVGDDVKTARRDLNDFFWYME
jgi:hypothetical protein